MRLTVLQNNPVLGETEANLASVRKTLAGSTFDLLVLPELFTSGYFFHSAAQVVRGSSRCPGFFSQSITLIVAQRGIAASNRKSDSLSGTALAAGDSMGYNRRLAPCRSQSQAQPSVTPKRIADLRGFRL